MGRLILLQRVSGCPIRWRVQRCGQVMPCHWVRSRKRVWMWRRGLIFLNQLQGIPPGQGPDDGACRSPRLAVESAVVTKVWKGRRKDVSIRCLSAEYLRRAIPTGWRDCRGRCSNPRAGGHRRDSQKMGWARKPAKLPADRKQTWVQRMHL